MILPVALSLPAAAALAAAALVAARRGRTRGMAAAAGIAAALSPAGLALLPVLLGTAIARGLAGRALLTFAGTLAATLLFVGRSPVLLDVSAWHLGTEFKGLVAAVAIGGAAWLAASCSARRLSSGELHDAALLAALAGPLLLPLGAETLLLALGLVITGARPRLPVRSANDNPLPLRATA